MAGLTFTGLDELKQQLRNLPADATAEANHIVVAAANAAEAQVRAGYAEARVTTGNLMDHLYQSPKERGLYAASIELKNTAKHAWLWDNGSEARHYFEKSGKRHETGAMWGRRPAPHTFVKAAVEQRRIMYDQLRDMLVRLGATVTGSIDG